MTIWAPFFKNDHKNNELKWEYSLHNVFSAENHDESSLVKVRITTDTGFEFVHNIEKLKANRITTVTCEELDKRFKFKEKLVKTASSVIGGKGGGGRKDFAQAGGIYFDKIEDAFKSIKSLI